MKTVVIVKGCISEDCFIVKECISEDCCYSEGMY